MKSILLAAALLVSFQTAGMSSSYVYVPFTKTATYPNGAPLPVSTGLLYDSQFTNTVSFTNVAAVYHPAVAGSFVDSLFPVIAPYVPAESWSLNLGGGGSSGNYLGGIGFSVNLLDTVRQELSVGLKAINSPATQAIAAIVAPSSTGNVMLTFGPQWTAPFVKSGAFQPLNQLRVTNHWFAGVGYTF